MAKVKPVDRVVDSYTIKGTTIDVKAGDCVLMQPHMADANPYVGRVEQIEADKRNNLKVRVRWYYRPEETWAGRLTFHGAKEVFLSDHIDIQSAHNIFGKCRVHTFKEYTKLGMVEEEDYFCRIEYYPRTQTFLPDQIPVYCTCEIPYNPDDLMVQCEQCVDWFHPDCVKMKLEEATEGKHFLCPVCEELKAKEKNFVCPEEEKTSILDNNELSCTGTLAYFKKTIAHLNAIRPAFSKPSIIKDVKKPIALANGKSDNSINQDLKRPEDVKRPIALAKCKRTPKRQRN